MEKEGKYIYCIIGTRQERNFGPRGIGGRGDEVLTIGYEDLGMVVSNHPITRLVVNRENMLAHEMVVEEVMKEFTVLPVRFCTIASNADEIRNLLDRRHREFKNLLRDMDHKVELGIKAVWKTLNTIFKEIVKENKEIKKLKGKLQKEADKKNGHPDRKGFSNGVQPRMELGKMVEQSLAEKKEKEAGRLVDALSGTFVDYRLNRTIGDEMFMNAAFLIDKGREKEFDNIMDEMSKEYKDRIRFMYTGPLPPYNFVNINIYQEEWEK